MRKLTPVDVIFRKFKEGDVIALMPSFNSASGAANRGMIMSYMHFGQHSEACPTIVNVTKLAKPDEYADLLKELRMIGYKVIIRKRLNWKKI